MSVIETRAVVISLDGNEALVESRQGGGCGRCDSENGCGSGKLSQLFATQPRRFRVRNEANAEVGSEVLVTLTAGVLLRSAMLMYILPLVLLFAGAAVAGAVARDAASADGYAGAGGLAGLVLGFVLAKWLSLRQRGLAVAQPVIASCSSSAAACGKREV
jgi:sigma-E factor negative regulatory protein RseC